MSYRPYEKDIIDLAKKRNEIIAVSLGNNPETGERTYYLFTDNNSVIGYELSNLITELDLRILDVYGKSVNLAEWPGDSEDVQNESFLGKVIWR